VSATARPLSLTALPLLAVAGRGLYANHAVTLEHGDASSRHRPSITRLLRSCLQPGARPIWLSREGLSLLGLAAVRPRGGDSAWEIDSLILGLHSEAFVLDLLERCIATAGAHSAHRLFLRLPAESSLIPAARRQGFAAVCTETLLTADSAPAPLDPRASMDGWRRRRRDDHDLFQIFSRAVPSEVRWQTALTPREWRALQDPLGRGAEEWVWDPNGDGVTALARIVRSRRTIRATLLTEDGPEGARALTRLLHALSVGTAATKGRLHRVQVLLPDYLPILANTLREHGLQDTAQYDVGVRPIAQRTQRLQLAEKSVEGASRPVIQ
jgi:hypothetical protein